MSSTRSCIPRALGCAVLALAASCALASLPHIALARAAFAWQDSTTTTGTVDATGTPEATPTASAYATSTIGHSLRGRRIVLERFGSGARHILIVAGIHGDEAGGPVAAKFSAYLRAHPSAVASGTQVDLVAYANPDGRSLNHRSNARRVDLNRNFPASNWTRKHRRGALSHGKSAGSEPETKALMALLKTRRYERVLSLHSRGGVVDHNGKGSLALARRIAKAAHIRLRRLGRFPGSMGSYVPERLHTPIVTWELSNRTLSKRVRAGLLASVR